MVFEDKFFLKEFHDLFEKIVPEVITTTIARMHRDKLLDADEIYRILNQFTLNSFDRQNPINFESSLSALSSSQGRTFCKIFLLALEGKLPYNDPLFQGFLLITSIVDMVYSPFFYKSWFQILESKIEKLLRFVRCALNLSIYPKLHFLTHYPDIIKRYGPLRLLCTDQFESAHRHFKEQLINSQNHREVILTMFKGALCKYSYMYGDDFIRDSCIEHSKSRGEPSDEILQFVQARHQEFEFLSRVKYFGYKYEPGLYIFSDEVHGVANFQKILAIILCQEEYLIVVSTYEFVFLEKLHAYKKLSQNSKSFQIIQLSDIWNEVLHPYFINDVVYICPPYKLSK